MGVVVWGGVGAASAQPRPDVTLWVEGDSVTAGEPFILNIEGSTPAHRGISFPGGDADSLFGGLEILDRSKMYTRRVGGGYAIDSVAYTMQASARDSVRIPPVPIRVDVVAGTLTTHTEPRTVWVRGVEGGPSIIGFVRGASARRWGWWGLVAVVAVVCAGVGYFWKRRGRDEKDKGRDGSKSEALSSASNDPYEHATRRLQELRADDLTTPEAVEAFYVGLAETVRTYLAQRLNLALEHYTTREVVTALDNRSDVPTSAVEKLRAVLQQADLVKFAAARPDPETATEARAAAKAGLDAIESTVRTDASAEPTAASASPESSL